MMMAGPTGLGVFSGYAQEGALRAGKGKISPTLPVSLHMRKCLCTCCLSRTLRQIARTPPYTRLPICWKFFAIDRVPVAFLEQLDTITR